MLWLAILLLVAGLLGRALGKRGRRIDLHLVCRACGFDLFNRPETSVRCPECGADTRPRWSMRVGNRRPLPGVVFASSGASAAGALLIGLITVHWAMHADWIGWTPTAMLRTQMFSTDARTRTRACAEMLRRLDAHRGSDREVGAIIDELLRRQAAGGSARGAPWFPQWGDVVQTAILDGRATPAQAETYLRQAVRVAFEVRPRARAGDPLPLSFVCNFHGGSELGPLAGAEIRPQLTVTVKDGATWNVPLRPQALDSAIPIPLTFAAAILPDAGALPAGSHLLHMTCVLRVVPQRAAARPATVTREADLAVQILPESQSSVDLLDNAQAARAIAGAVRVAPAATTDGGHLGWLTLADPPLPVAFQVILKQDGRTWVVGRFIARPNGYARLPLSLRQGAPAPRAGTATLVFRPDPELARGTTDILAVWAGTLRIDFDVPAARP
jgi:hypothetical protein